MASKLYRGDSRAVLAEALLALVLYARNSTDEFKFGPVSLDALERDGLEITGSDLEGASRVLDGVHGLVSVDR